MKANEGERERERENDKFSSVKLIAFFWPYYPFTDGIMLCMRLNENKSNQPENLHFA